MKLSRRDHERILRFYNDSLNRYGNSDSRSVRWPVAAEQLIRFQALLGVGDVSQSRLLDVGCGLGDLYKYLLQCQIEVTYTGIDIVPELISAAQQRFPDGDFRNLDIFDVGQRYDYVLASGALSFKVENNQHYYQEMIRKMYELAKKAVAFNMLDNRIHSDDETYAAYSPIVIADFCSTFASRVEVVPDYLPQDFAIYLYK